MKRLCLQYVQYACRKLDVEGFIFTHQPQIHKTNKWIVLVIIYRWLLQCQRFTKDKLCLCAQNQTVTVNTHSTIKIMFLKWAATLCDCTLLLNVFIKGMKLLPWFPYVRDHSWNVCIHLSLWIHHMAGQSFFI